VSNYRIPTKPAELGFVLIIALIIAVITAGLTIADAIDNSATTQRMTVCVKSGGQWLRDGITAYYECKR
jgi:hypothetical protein